MNRPVYHWGLVVFIQCSQVANYRYNLKYLQLYRLWIDRVPELQLPFFFLYFQQNDILYLDERCVGGANAPRKTRGAGVSKPWPLFAAHDITSQWPMPLAPIWSFEGNSTRRMGVVGVPCNPSLPKLTSPCAPQHHEPKNPEEASPR